MASSLSGGSMMQLDLQVTRVVCECDRRIEPSAACGLFQLCIIRPNVVVVVVVGCRSRDDRRQTNWIIANATVLSIRHLTNNCVRSSRRQRDACATPNYFRSYFDRQPVPANHYWYNTALNSFTQQINSVYMHITPNGSVLPVVLDMHSCNAWYVAVSTEQGHFVYLITSLRSFYMSCRDYLKSQNSRN